MLVGRTLSGFISGSVSSRSQLIAVSSTAIILIILAIFIPKTTTFPVPEFLYEGGAQVPVSAFLLTPLRSVHIHHVGWHIQLLAVEGLGKYTAQASGIFS